MPHDALATASAQPAASTAPQLHHLQPTGLYDATPNGYTHVVTVHGPAQWAFVSGQGGENQAGDLPDSFAAQAQQAAGAGRFCGFQIDRELGNHCAQCGNRADEQDKTGR